MTGFQVVLTALVAGILSVVLAIALIRGWDRLRRPVRAGHAMTPEPGLRPMVFLFRDGILVDATAAGRALLHSITGNADDWARLTGWLAARLPASADLLAAPAQVTGRHELRSTGDGNSEMHSLRLLAEGLGNGLLRLTLTDPATAQSAVVVDSLVLQAMEDELDLLRRSMDQTPMLVWRQDADDRITWANAAYLTHAESLHDGGRIAWPLPQLLDVPRIAQGTGGMILPRRAQLNMGGSVLWYDCHSHRVGDQTMVFALPADAAVRAERSLREFVQTLTKTFADLPTGLAIFDRDRKLQLFNPALIDLTNLPTGFLTARPTLFDFLDQLREGRMVPEPKDYRSWRQQMNNLENAAATGRHVETWSLPGGQTYRVTGRPHPDGAVAFVFEDITSEVSLTRRFRAELSLGAHVLDGLDDALIVFAPGGQVLSLNRAYVDLWGEKAATMADAIARWERVAEPGEGMRALHARLTGGSAQETARDSGAMLGPDGRLLSWAVTRIAGGRMMIRFRGQYMVADSDSDPSIATQTSAHRAVAG